MNILIITSGYLPIPAIKGGAVEKLVEFIVDSNEIYKKHNIKLYSIYDEKIDIDNKYKNCEFKYINPNTISYKVNRLVRGIINKLPSIYVGNAYIYSVRKMLKKENIDDVDFIIIENCPEFALVLKDCIDKKLILHLHNDSLNIGTKLNKEIFNSYFKILAISKFVSNRVQRIDENNKDKVNVLYNGIDLSKFNKKIYDSSKIKSQYNINESAKIIMFSGRLVKEKGVKELIEAFIKISTDEDIKLLIVGGLNYSNNNEDSYIRELKQLSSKYKDKILFTGFVEYDEIPKLYAIADIGVVPSLCNDAFNLTTIEYMQNEIPVIVSSNGAMKELINDNCGIIVEYDNNFIENLKEAMIRLLDDNKRKEMGKNAMLESNKFSKEIYCSRFDMLLDRFEMELCNDEK